MLAHADWLSRLARHLVNPDVADDAVYETWAAPLRSPGCASVQPWLARVMRNFVRRRLRGEGRRHDREESVARSAGVTAPAADDLYERVELQRRLAELVMTLDEPWHRGRSARPGGTPPGRHCLLYS
jgi:DNA-directed RNA polymerase specialized sigma24 family protein